jgi:CRP-like cAMP-binding protein
MYLIESGKVRVSVRVPGDVDLKLAISGAGAMLGEVAMLDGGKRSASAIALEPVTVHFLSYRLVQALRHDHRPAALNLIRKIACVVCKRIREAVVELGDRICRPVPGGSTTLLGPLPSRVPSSTRRPSAAGLDPKLLRNIPFFDALSPDELALLLKQSTLLEAERGMVLGREGERADGLRIIVRGAIQKRIQRGELYQRLFLIGPGHVSGAPELIDGGKRVWTSTAREQTLGLEIATRVIEELVASGSSLGLRLMDASIDELMSAHRRISREKVRHALEGTIDLIGPGKPAQRGL